MNIQTSFTPEGELVTINVETNLLSKYFSNFKGLIKNDPDSPAGIDVERLTTTSALITFPIDKVGKIQKVDENRMAVAIDSSLMEKLNEIINLFVNCALRKEFNSTEFIPLSGYPVENLIEDIQGAVKNKRNLCIIDEYSEYLKMQKDKRSGEFKLNQVMVEYGTSEYSECAILLYNGNLEELKNKYQDKLVYKSWC